MKRLAPNKTRTGPRNERNYPVQEEPGDPQFVIGIVARRHFEEMTFKQIGREIGCSPVNAFKLFHRWKGWALEEYHKGHWGADA